MSGRHGSLIAIRCCQGNFWCLAVSCDERKFYIYIYFLPLSSLITFHVNLHMWVTCTYSSALSLFMNMCHCCQVKSMCISYENKKTACNLVLNWTHREITLREKKLHRSSMYKSDTESLMMQTLIWAGVILILHTHALCGGLWMCQSDNSISQSSSSS